MNRFRWLKYGFLVVLVVLAVVTFWANHLVIKSSSPYLYASTDSIPHNKVALILGTSKFLKSGNPNQYFSYRIHAAWILYQAGKVEYFVISGDNSRADYNEPQDMKEALVMLGVPEDRIYLDYAGFRTFDSVYRLKVVFGVEKFTVVSQEFHNMRALYIANALNMQAVGFNAQDVDLYNGIKTQMREKLARVKLLLDVAFGAKPKFLGDRIEVGE